MALGFPLTCSPAASQATEATHGRSRRLRLNGGNANDVLHDVLLGDSRAAYI
jgi:hypothetical protein